MRQLWKIIWDNFKTGVYKKQKTPTPKKNPYTPVMMRRGFRYTKPRSKGEEKAKQTVSLYTIKTVLIKDGSSFKIKHAAIYSEYTSTKNFESWRNKFTEKAIFNATTKINKESIFITKKFIKTEKGEIIDKQYFRLYRIGNRWKSCNDFKRKQGEELLTVFTSAKILEVKNSENISSVYSEIYEHEIESVS